jgi:8-oxo-dGTP pyrophosphatase MutT (NUDIX family)
MKMPKERSAGIIVLKWSNSGWLYLTLVTTMRTKTGDRKLDFPKGHVEGDEDWIEAAIRETREEAGIEEEMLNFTWGDQHFDCFRPNKTCRMFIASTSAKPSIEKNPVTKKYEHIGWKWLSLSGDRDEQLIHPYIREAVDWARSIVTGRRLDSTHVRMSQSAGDPPKSQ